MRIGEKLRMIREARGLSQEELADRLSVSIPAISRWESGARTFPADELGRIADALGVEAVTFYASEAWGKIEEARRIYDAVIAELQAIFNEATDITLSADADHTEESAADLRLARRSDTLNHMVYARNPSRPRLAAAGAGIV